MHGLGALVRGRQGRASIQVSTTRDGFVVCGLICCTTSATNFCVCLQDKVVLRYEAVLEPSAAGSAARLIAIDRERKFVVSFFLADQTLAVFEPPRPNT